MPVLQKFYCFVEDKNHGHHDMSADTLKWCLTNTAPDLTADLTFADIVEIAAGNGYTAGGTVAALVSSAQTGGIYKLVLADVTFTAAGGPMATFRYAVLYNDTSADRLIGMVDAGSAISLADTQSEVINVDATAGVYTDA